ncbi:hypothetical protein V8G54_017552 [Vigna mungo]|uniref:Uncharacterized protein n=1 Tax=Vigna mungo TaxID=3915 RepID=A0AAQ3S0D6_VIGMU
MYVALKKIGQRLIGMVVRNQLRGIRDCLGVGRPRYFMPLFAFHSLPFFSFTCFSFFTIYSLLRSSSLPHYNTIFGSYVIHIHYSYFTSKASLNNSIVSFELHALYYMFNIINYFFSPLHILQLFKFVFFKY